MHARALEVPYARNVRHARLVERADPADDHAGAKRLAVSRGVDDVGLPAAFDIARLGYLQPEADVPADVVAIGYVLQVAVNLAALSEEA